VHLISKKDYFMNEKAVTLRNDHIRQTVKVVAAYISNNSLPAAELPSLIFGIYSALSGLRQGGASEAPMVEKPTPGQVPKTDSAGRPNPFNGGKAVQDTEAASHRQWYDRRAIPRALRSAPRLSHSSN